MLRCEFCNVDLPGEQAVCPLCQSTPSGTPDGSIGPYPPYLRNRKLLSPVLLAWIAFGSVFAIGICIAINIAIPDDGWWSLFVTGGILSFWINFSTVLKKRGDLPKNIIWQVVVLSVVALAWDFLTDYRGWALNYVIPFLICAAMIALVLVAKVQKLDIHDYILYLLLACIFGFVPFVLLLTGLVGIRFPSLICYVSSIVFLGFLLFFEGKALWAEFKRRMHL